MNLNVPLKEFFKQLQIDIFEVKQDLYVMNDQSFAEKGINIEKSKYEGFLLYYFEAKENLKRKEIVDLTRKYNRKSFGNPVLLFIKYDNGTKISLALSERVEYKQEWREGEKIGKVIILRDIDTGKPHAGHLRILEDLKRHNVKNFSELYERWLEIFNVNVLNKKFYDDLSKWYFWAIKEVNFPNDMEKDEEIRNSTNLIRLVTRIIFIWFIKEKKLVPENLFDEKELENILRDFKKKGNYYNAILQNLFFGTLNQKIKERKFAEDGDLETNKNEYGVKNLYRYANMFKSKDEKEICKLFGNIPFLNGGLFDCLDKEDEEGKVKYIDGFSRNKNKQAKIPDILFFNSEPKCQGLIKILNSYKFTITENTPQEEDVALDPELLGKVFENLLASYNPETKETARKQSGSFYTPREIVNYMVNESLAAYLREKVGDDWENNRQTISALNEIKILDPACGSGAFPMGILHRMVELLQKLDPKNELWKQRQLDLAEKIEDLQSREAAIENIERAFAENELDYGRKLFLIENCIYGVDIQPIAIQISKLRFFLSLVIEQKIDGGKENYGIRPLPNLETKFVAANTLVGLEKENSLFRTAEINDKENELKQVRHEYFTANNRKKKLDLQKKDRRLRKELSKMLKAINFAEKSADNIANFDPYDQNVSSKWFDAEWMFGLAGGFDVVIGNPPYGAFLSEDSIKYFKNNYKMKTTESAILFIEKGLYLCKECGIQTYIVPKSFTFSSNYEKIRDFVEKELLQIVDCGKAFENVLLEACIILNQKEGESENYKSVSFNSNEFEVIGNINKKLKSKFGFYPNGIVQDEISIGQKIVENNIFLNDITHNSRGETLQKSLKTSGKYSVIGGKEINKYGIRGVKGFVDDRQMLTDKAKIKDVGILVQNIIAHITQPFDRIKIIACISDRANCFITDTINQIIISNECFDKKYIWALLNSNLVNWFVYRFIFAKAIRTMHFDNTVTSRIPIPNISLEQQQTIITLVNQILSAKKENPAADTAEMEREIDRLVYGLYGLTEEEVGVIEKDSGE